jgi:hypothetical protein
MADLGGVINIEKMAEEFRSGFEVLPPGWYLAAIVKSELKPTSTGGKQLVLTWRTVANNVDIIDRVNIVNTSDKAQSIGRSQLAKIAQCCGLKGELRNSDKLHGRPCKIKLIVEEFESNKEAGKMLKSNKVKDYAAKSESVETEKKEEQTYGTSEW